MTDKKQAAYTTELKYFETRQTLEMITLLHLEAQEKQQIMPLSAKELLKCQKSSPTWKT